MRPVTSQVAAEIGYDPAGGTDPGPFTQQVAERLHAADPRWGRRINSTGPISDDTVAYRVGTSPVNPLSIDIVLAAHTTHARLQWHTYDHWAETPGAHPTISRHIPVYLGSFFLFAGRVSGGPSQQGGTQDAECRPAPAADNQDATKAHLRRSYDGLNLGFVLTLDKRSPIYAPRGPSKMVPAVTEVW